MEFNSQICTTREQSERLLSLGLKKETADMTWCYSHTMKGVPQYDCKAESTWDSETISRYVNHCERLDYFSHWKHRDGTQMTGKEVYSELTKKDIPAWSLHRLIELVPQENDGIFFSLSFNDAGYSKPGDWVLYERIGAYDSLINCIEWLIKEGYFNKEYLV